MAAEIWININNTLTKVKGVYKNIGGVLTEVKECYKNIGGVLTLVYESGAAPPVAEITWIAGGDNLNYISGSYPQIDFYVNLNGESEAWRGGNDQKIFDEDWNSFAPSSTAPDLVGWTVTAVAIAINGVSFSGDSLNVAHVISTTGDLKFTMNNLIPDTDGTCQLSVTIDDGNGNDVTKDFLVTIRNGTPV